MTKISSDTHNFLLNSLFYGGASNTHTNTNFSSLYLSHTKQQTTCRFCSYTQEKLYHIINSDDPYTCRSIYYQIVVVGRDIMPQTIVTLPNFTLVFIFLFQTSNFFCCFLEWRGTYICTLLQKFFSVISSLQFFFVCLLLFFTFFSEQTRVDRTQGSSGNTNT